MLALERHRYTGAGLLGSPVPAPMQPTTGKDLSVATQVPRGGGED